MTNPVIQLLLVTLFTVGPVVGLMLLLNARDRRQAALLGTMWSVAPRDLRDLIAVQVRCALLSGGSVVEVDMRDCARDEIWEALARWCAGLPPGVRLLVSGSMDRGLAASFTVETAGGPARGCPRPASARAQ